MTYNENKYIVVNPNLKDFAGKRGTLRQRYMSGIVAMYSLEIDGMLIDFDARDLLSLEWDDTKPLEIERYRELANAVSGPWLYKNDQLTKLLYSTMSMCSEAGEIASITTKIGYQGHPLTQEKIDKLILELGDSEWYSALLAHALGVSLEEVMKRNLKKLHERYPNGFTVEESINRKA